MPDLFKWSFRQELLLISLLALPLLPPGFATSLPVYGDDFAPAAPITVAPNVPSDTDARPTLYPNPQPERYLFEDQLSPGMKGYGLTVMHGGKIEKFSVEIIDIIKDFSPGNNVILVRCTGLGLEHSGIIAGMSGSPVFIHDRMIGAVAYGWDMSKDPIGGVQPIRQMLSIKAIAPEASTQPAAQNASIGGSGLSAAFLHQASSSAGWKSLATAMTRREHRTDRPFALSLATGSPWHGQLSQTTVPANGEIHPLSSPLMIGNASPATLQYLRESLAGSGLVPLASGSAGRTIGTAADEPSLGGVADIKPNDVAFAPGSAIALPLVSGDMDMSAIGTVTEVRDGKVYAFGHNFMGSGPINLPIATAYIFTVLPAVNESFKMGTSVSLGGTLVSDEQTGIVGFKGKAPPAVPVTLSVHTSDNAIDKTYHYQLAPHPKLTTEMMGAILTQSMGAQRVFPTNFTAHLTGDLLFSTPTGPRKIAIDELGTQSSFSPMAVALPISVLTENPYHNLPLLSADLHAEIDPIDHSAELQNATIDRLIAKPGDSVILTVDIAPYHGDHRKMSVTLKIPEETEDGDYSVFIGTSEYALGQETEYAPQHFDPQNLSSLLGAVDRILAYRPDHLYAGLILGINGAAIGTRELADLPGSRLAMYNSDRRTDTTPLMKVVRTDLPADAVLTGGGQTFSLHVDRHADQRYYNPHATPGGIPGSGASSAAHAHLPSAPPPPATDPSDSP